MSDTNAHPAPTRVSQSSATTLLPLMREATRELHTAAERSGIYRALLTGHAELRGYTLLLRNLEPVYGALERELAASHKLSALVPTVLYRSAALVSDLETLVGPQWRDTLPELPASIAYVDRLKAVAREAPARLIAHVYTRYLGDLAGGRMLHDKVRRQLGTAAEGLAYFAFAGHADPTPLAVELRQGIEIAGAAVASWPAIIEEACTAFRLTIALSTAVQVAAGDGRDSMP